MARITNKYINRNLTGATVYYTDKQVSKSGISFTINKRYTIIDYKQGSNLATVVNDSGNRVSILIGTALPSKVQFRCAHLDKKATWQIDPEAKGE